jgi:hypothetical protein
MIKNKTILLICKESISPVMFFLGKELEKNNDVHYYFIHNSEVINKNPYNKYTYFYFKENIENKKIHDVKELNIQFLKNKENISINYNRLEEIEKKYTHFANLNKQILCSQMTSMGFHDRFYYNQTTYEQNIYWLILNYDKTENLLEKLKPDYIFDLDLSEIQRTIINEVAYYNKIPYINFEFTRYSSSVIPTFNLGNKQPEKYFMEVYKKNKNEGNLEHYIKEVKKFRDQSKIMPNFYRKNKIFSNKYNFLNLFKDLILMSFNFIKIKFFYYINRKYPVKYHTPMFSNPLKRLLFLSISYIRKFYLYSNYNKFFLNPLNERYVYFTLHVIPESSTFIKAPMYTNELSLIQSISKILPINWKLYVKEHPSMIGQRNLEFYKKISKIQNVKLVKMNAYQDPKPWIEKSEAVISISGSAALEAAMLNKPSIVFGEVCFSVISGVKVVKSFEEVERLLKLINIKNWPKDNITSCATYLKSIDEVGLDGFSQPLSIIKLCEKKIRLAKLTEDEKIEFENSLNHLIAFYEKAVKIFNNRPSYDN